MKTRSTGLASRSFVFGLSGVVACWTMCAIRAQETEIVSVTQLEEQGDTQSRGPAVSADGRYVVFASRATNLVPSDTNGVFDVFVKRYVDGRA